MRSRGTAATMGSVLLGVALTACSQDDDPGTAPTLPSIVTTASVTTIALVATTLPKYYEVQRGDTLTEIAAAYSIPVAALLAANPEVSSPDDIQAGQFLAIPPREGLVAAQLPPTVPGQSVPPMPTMPLPTATSVP